jgi:hypothetical protein
MGSRDLWRNQLLVRASPFVVSFKAIHPIAHRLWAVAYGDSGPSIMGTCAAELRVESGPQAVENGISFLDAIGSEKVTGLTEKPKQRRVKLVFPVD